MAKKNQEDEFEFDDSMEEEGRGSKILSVIIGIIIFLILLALVAGFIKLDIGGVGTNVLRPVLKDVPVINKILPEAPDTTIAEEKGYDFNNITDAVKYIEQLEAKIKTLEDQNSKSGTNIGDLQAEIDRLKVFETERDEFNQKVLEFDTNVVFNDKAPEVTEYQKYYEGISPDNAAEIYRQVVEKNQVTEKMKEQADRYSKMEPAAAADALQVMTSDLDLVANILNNMSTSKSALIMDQMEPDYCAKITKKMSMLASAN